ncbi:hypothetical protein HPB50_020956 [Hyalomma asiaticum]|uniref:Uncharacterized protein n=1 Tax=Hyalomma asiaticum TaxID=266040 RepID=A0ACB7SYN6_HYAAI|nr:hypothetical protein HPB50_020956 [Hyalomma asiaticum]
MASEPAKSLHIHQFPATSRRARRNHGDFGKTHCARRRPSTPQPDSNRGGHWLMLLPREPVPHQKRAAWPGRRRSEIRPAGYTKDAVTLWDKPWGAGSPGCRRRSTTDTRNKQQKKKKIKIAPPMRRAVSGVTGAVNALYARARAPAAQEQRVPFAAGGHYRADAPTRPAGRPGPGGDGVPATSWGCDAGSGRPEGTAMLPSTDGA